MGLKAALKDCNCKGKRRPELVAPREHLQPLATTGLADAVSVQDAPTMQHNHTQAEVIDYNDVAPGEEVELGLVDGFSLRTDSSVELELADGFGLRTDSSVGWPASRF